MMTGWLHHKHKVNRPVSSDEAAAHLERSQRSPVLPDDRSCCLRLNSVYAEFVDNRFMDRGYPALAAAMLITAALLFIWTLRDDVLKLFSDNAETWDFTHTLPMTLFLVGLIGWVWHGMARKDLWTYTHYPIRFNRRERMVYAFRHNGPGGVLTVPWDKAFFFIGRGVGGDKRLVELRCHVLDENGMIVGTFGIGQDDITISAILELWEMIRLYMEDGPQAVPQYPVALFPRRITLYESWMTFVARVGRTETLALLVLSPYLAVLTVMHYLALKTSKAPVWPEDVEEACRFDPDDPYILPEERYGSDHPRAKEVWDAVNERRARNRQVALAWEQSQGDTG